MDYKFAILENDLGNILNINWEIRQYTNKIYETLGKITIPYSQLESKLMDSLKITQDETLLKKFSDKDLQNALLIITSLKIHENTFSNVDLTPLENRIQKVLINKSND